GDIRRDFPGGWPGDKNNAFIEKDRTKRQNQYFNFSKHLFNSRKNKTVIHRGKNLHFLTENNVYVYFRYNQEDRIMVIINNNNEAQTLNLKRFREGIRDCTTGTNIFTGDTVKLENTLEIPGKTPLKIGRAQV